MQAVILAAGEGTRLAPLTNVRPKPMLPIANRPLLEYVIEAVAAAGISDIVLVVGYERERIQSYIGDGDKWGVDISYVFQSPQLGTGHAIAQTKSAVGEDFLVLNGDRIVEPGAITKVKDVAETTGQPAVAITSVDEPELFGVVERNADNRITNIEEKPHSSETPADHINAGIYAFGQEMFAALDQTEHTGELTITDTINQHIDTLHPIAVPYDGQWLDVSRPWDLLSVNSEILDHDKPDIADSASIPDSASLSDGVSIAPGATIGENVTINHGTAIGPNVTVRANTVLDDSIILADSTIGAGVIVSDAVLGQNSRIGPGTVIEGGEADVYLDGESYHNVRFGGFVGDNAAVGGNVTITPGTRVGNETTIGSGCILEGEIAPEAIFKCR